jgi:tRNA threonylcarbamoyladenosine biosynthesis protein TsaE
LHWLASSQDQTEALGAALARAWPTGGEAAAIVYLRGELGSGKTTLARGFIRALGIDAPVRSPTYALLQTYEGNGVSIVHLDLYRLQSAEEAVALGLREHDRRGSVWLIEWPDRARSHLPAADLTASLRVAEGGHVIELEANTERGHAWLNCLEPVEIPTAWP